MGGTALGEPGRAVTVSLIPAGLGNATGRAMQAIQLLSLGLSFPSVNMKKYAGVCSGGGVGLSERPEVP